MKKNLLLRYFIIISSIIFLFIVLYPLYIENFSLDDYLKNYSSLILVFLTYVYVLLTYLILNSSNKLAKEQLRPYVIANFTEENNSLYFSIKNYGKRPAYNIKVNMSDGLEEFQVDAIRGNYKYLLEQKFLAPLQELKNFVTDPAYIISPRKKDINKCFDFNITFYDSDDEKYELKYQIDLNNFYDKMSIHKESVVENLEKIYKEIKNLNEQIKG